MALGTVIFKQSLTVEDILSEERQRGLRSSVFSLMPRTSPTKSSVDGEGVGKFRLIQLNNTLYSVLFNNILVI